MGQFTVSAILNEIEHPFTCLRSISIPFSINCLSSLLIFSWIVLGYAKEYMTLLHSVPFILFTGNFQSGSSNSVVMMLFLGLCLFKSGI